MLLKLVTVMSDLGANTAFALDYIFVFVAVAVLVSFNFLYFLKI